MKKCCFVLAMVVVCAGLVSAQVTIDNPRETPARGEDLEVERDAGRRMAPIVTPRGAPANDECADAIDVGTLPALVAGTTFSASSDAGIDDCGTAITSGGVWYSVTGTGSDMVATTCPQQTPAGSAGFDSKINVYCLGCEAPGPVCVASNDDGAGCTGFTSTVEWTSQAGAEYLILVHGFGSAAGNFELSVFEGGSGSDPVECLPPVPEGACCVTTECSVMTEDDCDAAGGIYQDDDTECEPETCAIDPDFTCGGFDIFEIEPGVYNAPLFNGTVIIGTNGPDKLYGTNGPNLILGRGGSDEIEGQGGDDVICAGGGRDFVEGGSGEDTIYGEGGKDNLHGDGGPDTIFGGNGRDDIVGGDGADELCGDDGHDLITGDDGGDILRGGEGNDVLMGGPGGDTTDGGPGNDSCSAGGQGADVEVNCES